MSGQPLHVMTFNVCGLPSSLLPLPERAVEFGRRIDESDVDVLNLQEVWFRPTLHAIRAGLPNFPHIAWRRALGGRPAGGLVTFSRHPLSTVEYSSYAGTRPSAGGLRFRVKRAFNGLMQGVLTTRLAGRRTLIANTQPHGGEPNSQSRTSPMTKPTTRPSASATRKCRASSPAAP